MTTQSGRTARDVVPRWRSVANTITAGEVPSRKPDVGLSEQDAAELLRREVAWKQHQTESFAAEFVGTAFVLGVPGRADDAAQFLATSSLASLRGLGAAALPNAHLAAPAASNASSREFRALEVARLRRSVSRDPRNIVAWLDLARMHAIAGSATKADRAVRTALALAPENRFVLRSAASFFVSRGDPDVAHHVLTRAARTVNDPWLLSAELAVASAADEKPRHIRAARQILSDTQFSNRDVSELSSQLATIELRSGQDRRARQLFRGAIEGATENALAQVTWAQAHTSQIELADSAFVTPAAFEARALRADQVGDWDNAVRNARDWLDDQPFSPEPAIFASYAASVGLDDWDLAVELAKAGLTANPKNLTLLNNVAYALIERGDLEDATHYLQRITAVDESANDLAVLSATRGLLAYRLGQSHEGRTLYEQAIAIARRNRLASTEAMASVMFAREEVRAATADARRIVDAAERASHLVDSPAVRRWLSIVLDSAARVN